MDARLLVHALERPQGAYAEAVALLETPPKIVGLREQQARIEAEDLDGQPVPADQIDWASGFAVLERMFIAYGNPAAIVDSFAALFAVGVLLALVRVRTGNIAACIGMHAAWVCTLYCYGALTEFNPDSDASWHVGSYNEVIGWGTVMWMAVLAVIHFIVNRSMRTALAAR